MRALIDTGAKHSCINHKLIKRLKLTMNDPKGRCLYGANNNKIPVLGIANYDITINGLSMTSSYDVVENLSYDIILGMDFMTDNNAVIDITGRLISFQNNLVIATMQNSRNKPIKVQNLNSILI